MTKTLPAPVGSRPVSSRRRLGRTALALILSCSPLLVAPARAGAADSRRASATASYVEAGTIGEVLSLWRPQTHLYVLGDVGLAEDALKDLAAWLADTHWTVLLVQDATGQTYTDGDGLTRSGVDAIEFGTGQGLPQRPGFSAQVHPRTKERDGAIFTIVLAQRALFYTGSEAQDNRGLGEAQFKDNLDRWAIQALRSSGDLTAAVKDTVSNISSLLEGALDRELAQADQSIAEAAATVDLLERRAREVEEICPGGLRRLQLPDAAGLRARIEQARSARDQRDLRQALEIAGEVVAQGSPAFQALDALQHSVGAARAQLQGAATAITGLEDSAAGLRKAYPRLTGSLVRPGVERLRRELAAAEAQIGNDPEQTARLATAVARQALAQIKPMAEYSAVGADLTAAEARLAQLERRGRADAARYQLLKARQSLAAARQLHTQGETGYAERLDAAKRSLSAAEADISRADSVVAAIFFLLLLLAIALAVAAFVLNHRRRAVKQEAEQLLADWRAVLDRKLEVLLDEMERRAARFVGPASGEGKRPYAGETLRLAEQIRTDLGSLYILWTSASGVLQTAEALIRARRLGALYNFFFPGKYRQGIALLKDEPVPFDPQSGLPRLFGYERTWRDDLLGDLASYQPFRKSFQEIVAELNLRAGRAAETLDLVESSVVQGPSALEETGERIRQTGSLQREIGYAGFADGLFLVPAVFVEALPTAAAALERARALFPTDPVGALQGDGARARVIADDVSRIAGIVVASRQDVLPTVEAGAAALRQAGIATGWIEDDRARLSGRADLLAAQAAESSVAAGIEELARDLADLGARVERAVALSRVLGETARPEALRVGEIVRSAREELGGALGLPPQRLLREEDADPSDRVTGAAGQADAAQAALGRGELDAADASLAEAARLTAEAEAIVEATRRAFAAHDATVEERRGETARIEPLLPEHERILQDIREAFAPSVLSLRAGDPEHPEANATVEDNLEEARAHVGFAQEKLGRAVSGFREGRLLASAGLLEEIKRHQELAVHRLEEIAERRTRLEGTVESNRNLLEALEARVREDQVAVAGDPRVMQPTVAAFEQGKRRLQQARQAVEADPGDPFLAEEELLAARSTLAEVHDRMAPSDRLRFADARTSVETAAHQLAAADSLACRAAGDGVPDSPEIVRALRDLEALSAAQAQARESLGVHHGDWNALDAEADRIAGEAARGAATLTGEIAAAERAAAAVSSAVRKLREAGSWRSSYGIVIASGQESSALPRARSLLAQGRYEEAAQEADSAYQEAALAIAHAEAQERAEEQRHRQDEQESASYSRSSSSSSSGSVFSSGGASSGSSGSSWGSSGSGSGSSSWGSSGSGSGKSGW